MGSCEFGYGHCSSVKGGEFLDHLDDYQLLKDSQLEMRVITFSLILIALLFQIMLKIRTIN
jgi:hypothetical protein